MYWGVGHNIFCGEIWRASVFLFVATRKEDVGKRPTGAADRWSGGGASRLDRVFVCSLSQRFSARATTAMPSRKLRKASATSFALRGGGFSASTFFIRRRSGFGFNLFYPSATVLIFWACGFRAQFFFKNRSPPTALPSREKRRVVYFRCRGGGDWLLWFFIRRLLSCFFGRAGKKARRLFSLSRRRGLVVMGFYPSVCSTRGENYTVLFAHNFVLRG